MTETPSRNRGFSLLELMITLAVMAILLVIAVPNLRVAIQRNEVSSASNSLIASVSYARAEAISRGQMVSMCPSSDGVTCTASGLAFDPGWLVYTYPAGAATANQAYKASNILLRATSAREGVSILALNSAVVSFGQQGQLVSSATSTPSLTFITCYRSGSSGAGVSSSAVPGVELTVNGSGSVISTTLAAAASCTPS